MFSTKCVVAALVIAGVGVSAPALAQGPVFTPEDLLEVQDFAGGQPITLAPTGQWVAYVLTDKRDEGNVLERRPTGYVFVQAVEQGRPGDPKPLTQGKAHSSFPTWSPDGTKLAFFQEDAEGGQLAVWDARTNRTASVGERFAGRAYLAPQWHPDGSHIVYAPTAKPDDPKEPPRVEVVTSNDKRIPGDQFFVDDRRAGLAVVNLDSGTTTPLLTSPVILRSFNLSPTGLHLVYTAPIPELFGIIGEEKDETFVLSLEGGQPRRALAGKEGDGVRFFWSPDGRQLLFRGKEGRLAAVPVEGGTPSPFLPALEARVTAPVWSPDGARFVSLVPDPSLKDPEIEPTAPGMYTIFRPYMDLYLVSAADGTARNVTAEFEDQVSNPTCSPDGKTVYFVATNNQSYDQTVYRYAVDGGTLTAVTKGQEAYGDLSAGPAGLSLTIEDATHPADLWLADVATGSRTRLTTLNPQLARFRFPKPELFYYYDADGERLAALLYRPVDVTPEQGVPVITYVYEKLTPGVHQFNARNQLFLTRGYAMLLPNVKVKVGRTGTSFVKAVTSAVNAVRAMGFTNGRFALWGHSFGAYATSYVITQTDIFACAVSGATPPELFRNWASGRDRDSRNIETGQARMGGSAFEVPERYFAQSAFFHLNDVHTPVMILHGRQDLTILFGEGEMMFYALRQLGKEATFVAYAHGDHSLSRHSRADTLDVNHRMLDWFDRYLKGGPVSSDQPAR